MNIEAEVELLKIFSLVIGYSDAVVDFNLFTAYFSSVIFALAII